MPDELAEQLRNRLIHLMQAAQSDAASLHAHPQGQRVFNQLFDALGSTLQDVNDMPVERRDEPVR